VLTTLWLNGNLSSTLLKTTHTHSKHHYILHTKLLHNCLQREFSLHFTACLLRALLLLQTEHLCDDVNYLTINVIFKASLDQISRLFYCTHYDTLSTHHCSYFSENYETSLQEYYNWLLLCHCTHHLLMTTYTSCKQ
jgi:hypothetical protein